MAQHGYLREGYGMWGDSDDRDEDGRGRRDDDRERGWREDERGRSRDEQRWRGREDERGFMFGGDDRFRGDSHEWFGGRSREEGEEQQTVTERAGSAHGESSLDAPHHRTEPVRGASRECGRGRTVRRPSQGRFDVTQ